MIAAAQLSFRARDRVILLALVVGLLVLGILVRGGPLAIDLDLAAAVGGWYPRFATDAFDTLASVPVIAAVAVVGIVRSVVRRDPGLAVGFALGLASEIPTTLAKYAFDRPRPPGTTEVETIGSIAGYPSGHTVRAIVVAGMLVAAFAWAHRSAAVRWMAVIAAIAFVALVGLARVGSGQHWPTDVLGGIMLGLTWLIVCLSMAGTFDRWKAVPSTG